MAREKIRVQGEVGLDPLQLFDDAGQRADMLAKARHGRARRYRAEAAARQRQLEAGAKRDRRRLAAWISQLLASAGRTLGAMGDIVFDSRRAQQIVADDMVVQIGTKAAGDRLGDFKRGKWNSALRKRMAGQW